MKIEARCVSGDTSSGRYRDEKRRTKTTNAESLTTSADRFPF
jgi:hypothetical protein